MKKTTVRYWQAGLLLLLFFTSPLAHAVEPSSTVSVPVAVMSETVFEFPTVVEGESFTHDFIIQNHGNAVLNIPNVKTT
jgi:hypothetical protein